ncbi:MAG: ATP-binding protein [Ardenticatenaceae bacterium]|nr:ATP-binding protein [Ardenticatenaceae bacterium]
MSTGIVDIRIRQREFLLAISRALSAELDLSDVLRVILQASVEFIAGRAGLVVLADPNEHTFRVAAALGVPGETFEQHPQLVKGIPYEPGAEEAAIPLIDTGIQKLAKDISNDLDVAQTILLPMQSGDTIIGMIYVFQEKNFVFSSDAPNLLQSFADQAAIAVKNARLYEQVISEKKRLDAILDYSADGVMILDPQLKIEVFNQALSQITGWKPAEVLGCHHDTVLQWKNLRTETDLQMALDQGWPMPGSSHLYVEGVITKSNDDTVSLGVTYAPLLNPRGNLINIIANVRDLTRYREEEQLQKTFISVVSHELKTPVSIIKGYAGTLQRRDVDWPKEVMIEYLSVIEEEADSLTDLIDNLLEVSKLQAGSFKLNMAENISVPDIARQVSKKFSNQTKAHTFSVDFPADYPEIAGDERRITQVFNNLVSNAIKYSPEGGVIEIGGTINEDYVTAHVSDPGIGIPDHERHRIFQQFSRLDNALSRKTEGTGLGLFLTKAIIEAHHGRIWFSSNVDPDTGPTGTTFAFSLPK